MSLALSRLNLERTLCFLLKSFLFLFPWQTIWIYREVFVDGVKLEYATLGFYATEILLWIAVGVFVIWYWRVANTPPAPPCPPVPGVGRRVREGRLLITGFGIQFPSSEEGEGGVRCDKLKITRDRVFVFACLSLISYLFISVTWSVDKSLALQQSLHVLEAVLLFFMLMFGPLKFGEAVKWLALGAVLPAMLGIWQFFSQSTLAFKWLGLAEHIASNPGASVVVGDEIGRWLRAYGTFSHPNVFGGYLVMVIVLMLFAHAKCEKLRKCEITTFSIIYILIISALFFSFSRSALLALIIVILLNCFIVFWRKKYLSPITYHLSLIFLITIILSIILFPALKVRILTASPNEVTSVVERAQGFNESWEIFKDNLWLGVGTGNYTAYLQKTDPTRQPWEYQPVHNVGLLFLAESGVVGVALLLFVVISLIIYHLSFIKIGRLKDCKIVRLQDYPFFIFYLLSPISFISISYLTLAFFDHYLISSYIGLALTGVFFGLAFKNARTPEGAPLGEVVPNSSTAD